MSLSLRGRLAIVSALMFGSLLTLASGVSYHVLKHWLDVDATERLGRQRYWISGRGPLAC